GAYPSLSLNGGGGGASAAEGNVVKLEPRVRVEPISTAIPTIPATAIAPFLTQPLVVESDGLNAAPQIIATQEGRVAVSAGETAYADRIGAGGDINWQVYRPGVALRDPDTGEILGYEAKYVADARVRRFGNPTTLQIVKSNEEVVRGDRLAPARETTFPAYVPHAPGREIVGAIMSVEGGVAEIGQYQVITINRGSRDGIEVGHVLASYHRGALQTANGHDTNSILPERSGREYSFTLPSFGWAKRDVSPVYIVAPPAAPADDKKGGAVLASSSVIKLPDERNGLIFVFRVFDRMSYAMVMRATQPIYIGDIVRTP
ncbi:MAG TPA: peptidoglycan-binding protein LysM, partial [Usitatibacter sp.]|nr:peptidoglycan-binding protein LysM [Usitatibacter sp.]